MESGHDGADDLGDVGGGLRLGLGVGAAEGDEAVASLELLGLGESDAEFLGDLLGDGVSGGGDVAGEEALALGEEEGGVSAADVEDDDALVVPEAVGACGVEAGDGGDVDVDGVAADGHDGLGELLCDLVLDDDGEDVDLIHALCGDELVVVEDLVDGEGDVVGGLEFGHLADVLAVEVAVAKAGEAHEGGLTGEGDEGALGAEAALGEHLPEEAGDDVHARSLGELLLILAVGELRERDGAIASDVELAQLDAGGSDVDSQYFVFFRHYANALVVCRVVSCRSLAGGMGLPVYSAAFSHS